MNKVFLMAESPIREAQAIVESVPELCDAVEVLPLWAVLIMGDGDNIGLDPHAFSEDDEDSDIFEKDVSVVIVDDDKELIEKCRSHFPISHYFTDASSSEDEDDTGDSILGELERDIKEENLIEQIMRDVHVNKRLSDSGVEHPVILNANGALASGLIPDGCSSAMVFYRRSSVFSESVFEDFGVDVDKEDITHNDNILYSKFVRLDIDIDEDGDLKVHISEDGEFILVDSSRFYYIVSSLLPGHIFSYFGQDGGFSLLDDDEEDEEVPVISCWEVGMDHIIPIVNSREARDIGKEITSTFADKLKEKVSKELKEDKPSQRTLMFFDALSSKMTEISSNMDSYELRDGENIDASDIPLVTGVYDSIPVTGDFTLPIVSRSVNAQFDTNLIDKYVGEDTYSEYADNDEDDEDDFFEDDEDSVEEDSYMDDFSDYLKNLGLSDNEDTTDDED